MTTEWTPPRVAKIDRELAHEEQRLPRLELDVRECRERIELLRRDRQHELQHAQRPVA